MRSGGQAFNEALSVAETRLPTFVPVPEVEEEDAFAQEMPPSLFDEYVRQRIANEDAGAAKTKASSSWDAGAARKQRR